MPTRSKVFLPKWYRWFITPLLALVWAIMSYQAFWSSEGKGELSTGEWLGLTAVLALVGAVVWLMSSGKLPAYVIESDSTDEK